VLPGYRVKEILRDGDQVVGVEAEGPDGARRFLGRKAVIFATGGFTHNRELMDRHMPGYIPGGGAASQSRGDFVSLTKDLDVELAHMDKAWLGEVPVEFAIQSPETPLLLFVPFGDSMLYVDSKGRRSVNEKIPYDRRGQLHFVTDDDGEQPNKLLFMIYDKVVANDPNALSPTRWPIPPAGESGPWVVEAPTLKELVSELRERLARISENTGGIQLNPEFGDQLARTIARFNSFAESGRDEDFGRGDLPIEVDTTGMTRPGSHPNPTMYPLSPQGPYYAVILAAGTLDTKGGPRTDSVGRVLRSDGSPIAGLYGVGNCVASPSGGAYWSGGNTLGIACTFGYLAGSAAGRAASREVATSAAGVS
jgi:predicted oxidoreductase